MPRRRAALLRRVRVTGPGAPTTPIFSPADLPGLVVWLQPNAQGTLRGDPTGSYTGALNDASAIGTALGASDARLSQWDGSGGAQNFVQATTSAQPWWLQSQVNTFPAADFRAGQVMLSASNGNVFWPAGQTLGAEIVVMVQAEAWGQGHIFRVNENSINSTLSIRTTTTQVQWVCFDPDNVSRFISAPLPSTGVAHELRLVKAQNGIFGFIDGIQVAFASDIRGAIILSDGAVPITLGARSDLSNGFDGLITEVIARTVVLTSQDRLRESNYLRQKYSVPAPSESPAFTDGTRFTDGSAFTDTPNLAPTVSVSPLFSAPGGQVQVAVANAPGNIDDRVGLYDIGETDLEAFLDWKYLNGTQSLPATPLQSATLAFTAPASPGQYFFRLLAMSSGQLVELATSQMLTVETPTGAVFEAGVFEAGVFA